MPRREFSAKVKVAAFARCGGLCEKCSARLSPGKIDYDHIIPDALGGEPTLDNCAVLCRSCHRGAGSKTSADVKIIAKAKRVAAKHTGAKAAPRRKIPGSKGSGVRKRMDGTVEWER